MFPPSPPSLQPHSPIFPSTSQVQPLQTWRHTYLWRLLKFLIGSWPHLYSPIGGQIYKRCDYLAFKSITTTYFDHFRMKHFPQTYLTSGSPPLLLLIFLSFQDFSLILSLMFSDHFFFFFLFGLRAFLITLCCFLSNISSIHESTENNINIMNTHVPA